MAGECLFMAFDNILSSKLRSFLTMLGIIIGISAVMVIVGLGNGMENYITEMFASLGTNTLSVNITGMGSSHKMTDTEMYELIGKHSEYFDMLTPQVSMRGSVKIRQDTLDETSISGVSEDFFTIKDYTLRAGRLLHYMDMKNRALVCVIGSYVASEYFSGDAVGKTLRIGGKLFTVVGVLEQESEEEAEEGGTDDAVYLPYTTASRLSGNRMISSYTLRLVSEDLAEAAKEALEEELTALFRTENAYMVISMSEMLSTMTSMIGVVVTVLAVIAGISLLVGGVGIMNIMLVSVTERTREIGIRKALGARESFILAQFVMEAVVTSAVGGAIGILFGYALCSVATVIASALVEASLTVAPTVRAIALAFGASAGIGIIFGYLPAKKAAQLNPIDALHYE